MRCRFFITILNKRLFLVIVGRCHLCASRLYESPKLQVTSFVTLKFKIAGKSDRIIENFLTLKNEKKLVYSRCVTPTRVTSGEPIFAVQRLGSTNAKKRQSWALGTLKITTISVPILC